MKFIVLNYSCLQNPTRGLLPPDPCSLCPLSSTEFVEPPEQNSWVRHCHHWASLPKEFSHKQRMWEQRLAIETYKIYAYMYM